MFGSSRSPFARKAAIVALEAGLRERLEFIDVPIPAPTPNAALAAANPLRKLPTLVVEGGVALFDSPVICEYLAAQGAAHLFPVGGPPRWRALTRQALADGLLDMLLLWRAEMRRPEPERNAALFATWAQRRDGALDRCEAEAGVGALDIGDIAIGVLLSYLDFRFPEFDWRAGRPRLADWQAAIERRPSFAQTPFGADAWFGEARESAP